MCRRKYVFLYFVCAVFLIPISLKAQTDTTQKSGLDSFLLKQKGLLGDLAQSLLADTSDRGDGLQRNDLPFQRYRGKIIRRIIIQPLRFGVSISDTTKGINTRLTTLGNQFHRQTKPEVIRNNLFFRENDKLSPYVFGDNERHLRDLVFIQDARFRIRTVGRDSVDVIVVTKDVLSIGGSASVYNNKAAALKLKEDNLYGSGDHIGVQVLYDIDRENRIGYGAGFIKRNIRGSFIDASVGYLNFERSFTSGKREEGVGYLRLVRPLVNRFTQFTYGAELETRSTKNLYHTDSLYDLDLKYRYTIMDGWATWNMDADNRTIGSNNDDRVRRLVGLRVLEQNFSDKPLKYGNEYFYRYADLTAVLGEIAIFRQNFYKNQYMYGFGRNEDVPEGIEASATAGWTRKNGVQRAYGALEFLRYYFTRKQNYFNYTLRLGSHFRKHNIEDVSLLGSVSFFSRLRQFNNWKQRSFLGLSIAKQFESLLDEPLLIESEYGLPEFRNDLQGGDLRISLKTESVFYSPWSILLFRFAPFVFGNVSLFNQRMETGYDQKIYSSLGAGVRTRNESLIFGTIELRGMYFPRPDFLGETWRIAFKTNIRFKYNEELIKRPQFARMN